MTIAILCMVMGGEKAYYDIYSNNKRLQIAIDIHLKNILSIKF